MWVFIYLHKYVNVSIADHSGSQSFRAAVPNLFGTRDQFCGRQFFHGQGRGSGHGSGGIGSSGSRGNASFALLPTAHLLLCSPVPNN